MGILYLVLGGLLFFWGAFQARRAFRPFRPRPFLLLILGAVMIYNGLRMEQYIP